MRDESTAALEGLLPGVFADLERCLDQWALATEQQRLDKRVSLTMDELLPFYEAMLDRMPTIMDHLAKLPIDGLSSEDDSLLRLAFSYVEISRCFDAWNRADVRADFFPPKYLHTDG